MDSTLSEPERSEKVDGTGREAGVSTEDWVQLRNMLRIMGTRFFTIGEEIYKYEKRNRMDLVLLDWNGKYQCELMDLNIYR